MSEDEQKKDVVEETPQDEGAEAAGPVADEGSSSSQAAGDDPSSTPPAEEASGSDEAPAEEEKAEAPAAEEAPAPAEKAEPNPEDELPWKERRRLQRSRLSRKARAQLSPEERKAERLGERKRKAELRRKQRTAAKQERRPGTGTPPVERTANAPKVRQGVVVSSKGAKSITVRIDIVRRHPMYEKVVRRSRTLHAHDERNEAGEGDLVRVVETRPLSKTKRWRLVEVVEKAK
jgi:small subunit ribosomal protein S17